MKLLLFFLSLVNLLYSFEVGNGKSLVIITNSVQGFIHDGEHPYKVRPHPTQPSLGFVVLPIDYTTAPQSLNAQWISSDGTLNLDIDVNASSYPTETLSVDSAKVTPPPEAQERIAQEKEEAETLYATATPKRYWDKPFIPPMASFITSEFGSARTYNGVLKSYHGGVDFRAKTPLPILASNDGVVVLVKDRYYAGGTVIIDHGEGIYTCYFHMSQFDVSVGDKVSRGQTIGLSGATGRITGPHLHFGVMINGMQSDPLHFIEQINTLF